MLIHKPRSTCLRANSLPRMAGGRKDTREFPESRCFGRIKGSGAYWVLIGPSVGPLIWSRGASLSDFVCVCVCECYICACVCMHSMYVRARASRSKDGEKSREKNAIERDNIKVEVDKIKARYTSMACELPIVISSEESNGRLRKN